MLNQELLGEEFKLFDPSEYDGREKDLVVTHARLLKAFKAKELNLEIKKKKDPLSVMGSSQWLDAESYFNCEIVPYRANLNENTFVSQGNIQ